MFSIVSSSSAVRVRDRRAAQALAASALAVNGGCGWALMDSRPGLADRAKQHAYAANMKPIGVLSSVPFAATADATPQEDKVKGCNADSTKQSLESEKPKQSMGEPLKARS